MSPARLGPFAVIALVLASGCTGPAANPRPGMDSVKGGCPTSLEWSDAPGFQGENAWSHAAALSCDLATSPPRPSARVPGTPERDAAAVYIHNHLAAAGWEASFQNFTGNDYEALPKASLSVFLEPPYCKAEDLVRMRGLTFANVVGSKGNGSAVFVLMAHYDSKRFADRDPDPENRSLPVVGANDGASGVGVLLELARVLAVPATLEIRLLLVDGEDGFDDCHPDAGSLYYARSLPPDARQRIAHVLLLDMVGDLGAAYCLAGSGTTLADKLRQRAEEMGVSSVADAPGCHVYDDHTPFEDLDVPTVDLIDFRRPGTGFPPYWHTRADTMDRLSPLMLRDVGRVAEAAVRSVD